MDNGSSGAGGAGSDSGSAGGISNETGSGTRATLRGSRLQKSEDVKSSRGIAMITPAAIAPGATTFRRRRARRTESWRVVCGRDDETPRERPLLGARHPEQSGSATRRGAEQGS
jgi:hypothetical protein